jgi:drug/metabolite transporter (DMT)-like permease
MAEQVQIAGTSSQGKIRNPLGVVGLGLITLGIYLIFWYYFINKELAEMGKARNTEELGTSPGTSVLAITLGVLIIVPPFVSIYRTWSRKCKAEDMVGTDGLEAGLGFLLSILIGPVGHYLLQRDMNKVLQAQAAGGSLPPAAPPAPPVEEPAPPAQQPTEPPPPPPPAQ